MKQLWSPWRLAYILGPKPDACVFCLPDSTELDEQRLVLHRGNLNFIIMNKFPYASGHLLVAPYRHVADIADLTPEESGEMFSLLRAGTAALKGLSCPEGFNIGLNLGKAAGAGIGGHLHFHIVPRWNGDSSFMAVMDEIRVIPELVSQTYAALKPLISQSVQGEYDIHGGTRCGL